MGIDYMYEHMYMSDLLNVRSMHFTVYKLYQQTIRNKQIKALMRYHITSVKNSTNNSLVRVWRNGNSCALLVMQSAPGTVENSMEMPQKLKNRATI